MMQHNICSIFCLLFSWLQVPRKPFIKEGAELDAYIENRLELSYARMLRSLGQHYDVGHYYETNA